MLIILLNALLILLIADSLINEKVAEIISLIPIVCGVGRDLDSLLARDLSGGIRLVSEINDNFVVLIGLAESFRTWWTGDNDPPQGTPVESCGDTAIETKRDCSDNGDWADSHGSLLLGCS